MNKIDEQIKELQRRKEKISFFEKVREFAGSLTDPQAHEGLAKEVKAVFDKFINQSIESIEGSRPEPTFKKSNPATEDTTEPTKIQPKVDLVKFVQTYGNFSFKKVTAETLEGDKVTGTVKEVRYPNVMVESDGGGYLAVKPETLKLIGG